MDALQILCKSAIVVNFWMVHFDNSCLMKGAIQVLFNSFFELMFVMTQPHALS